MFDINIQIFFLLFNILRFILPLVHLRKKVNYMEKYEKNKIKMTETILAICILFKNFYLKLSLCDLLDDQKFSGSMSIHVRV